MEKMINENNKLLTVYEEHKNNEYNEEKEKNYGT